MARRSMVSERIAPIYDQRAADPNNAQVDTYIRVQ